MCIARQSHKVLDKIHRKFSLYGHIIQTKAQWLEINFKNSTEFPAQLCRIHLEFNAGRMGRKGVGLEEGYFEFDLLTSNNLTMHHRK